jgi:hypothetical protein
MLPRLPSCGLWSLSLFYFARVVFILRDIIYIIIILYSWHLAICEHFMCVCRINDHGQTCNEFLILFTKLDMTRIPTHISTYQLIIALILSYLL